VFCDLIEGLPVCNPVQSSSEGEGFFKVARTDDSQQLVNMPQGFEYTIDHAVTYMGLHAWNFGGTSFVICPFLSLCLVV
jgi:hypothetical protein